MTRRLKQARPPAHLVDYNPYQPPPPSLSGYIIPAFRAGVKRARRGKQHTVIVRSLLKHGWCGKGVVMEIAVLAEDDMEAAFRIWASAFNQGSRASISGWREDLSRKTGHTALGIKAPGLMACLLIIDFEIYFGKSATVAMGGIAAVASLAEARGRGYAGALLRNALERMRDRGQAFSMLFPFSWDYYRRFGWDWIGEQRRYSVPTHILKPSPETEYVRAAGASDRSIIETLYTEYGRRYRGPILRDEALWNGILNDTDGHFNFTYLYEKDGVAEGYLCFRGGSEEETRVREFVALTSRARAGLLGLLRRHDMKIKRFTWTAPADDLFWADGYHKEIETKLTPVVQARIVDVVRALELWKPVDTEARHSRQESGPSYSLWKTIPRHGMRAPGNSRPSTAISM